jgi:hypothetical protein
MGNNLMNDWVKYSMPTELPLDIHPLTSKYFLSLSDRLTSFRPSHTIKHVIGLYPSRPLQGRPDSLIFIAFCTNRTAFAALMALEKVFAGFYMETFILPLITPLPYKFYLEPEKLPSRIFKPIKTRGVMLYGTEG